MHDHESYQNQCDTFQIFFIRFGFKWSYGNGFCLAKLFRKTQNGRLIDDEHFICLSIAIEMSIFFVVHNCFFLQWRIFLFIGLRGLYANLRICQECRDAGRLKKCHSRRRKDKKAQEAESSEKILNVKGRRIYTKDICPIFSVFLNKSSCDFNMGKFYSSDEFSTMSCMD